MDGEFVVESMVHVDKGVGGGNLILQGPDASGRAWPRAGGRSRRSNRCPA